MFYEDDARGIKEVTVGGPGVDDYLAWNYTKNWYLIGILLGN